MPETTTTEARSATTTNGRHAKKAKRNELQDLPVQQQTLGLDTKTLWPNARAPDLTPFFVPLTKLRENPDNRGGVYDEAEIEAMARTLRVRQEQPIQVFHEDLDGFRRIHDGHIRFRAARKAGLPGLLAIEIPPLTEADAAASRFVHNVRRSPLTPWQEALEFQRMAGQGYSEKQIATRAGTTEAQVASRLLLVALPPEVGKRIGEPGFGVAHAEAILPLVQHPALLKAAVGLIGKLDRHDKRPPSAADYVQRVAQAVADKQLVATSSGYNWRRDQVLREKPFIDRLQKLPRVRIGTGDSTRTLILDREAYSVIEKEATLKADEAEARERARHGTPQGGPPSKAARAKQLWEAKVARLTRDRMYAAAGRACRAATDLTGPRLEFLLRVRLGHVYLNQARVAVLAALTDGVVSRDEWRAWHREYDSVKKGKLGAKILAQFEGKTGTGWTHLALALQAVEVLGDAAEDEWDELAPLLGLRDSWDVVESKVRLELKTAKAKTPAKKAAPKKGVA